MRIESVDTYAADIEERLDEQFEQRLWDLWTEWSDKSNAAGPFCPPSRKPSRSQLDWPHINMNDALASTELMVISQLEACHRALCAPSYHVLFIRPNYGVCNLPTMLGAKEYIMPREMDCLPNVREPLTHEQILRAIDAPVPDVSAGNGARITEVGERFSALAERFPKFGRFVFRDAPDLQGPMDNAELIWGSEIFYALYDEPETVHALLEKITQTYIHFFEHWLRVCPNDGRSVYAYKMCRGPVFLRDDSSMNLSPAMYEEFVYPYDARILAHFGGGGIHFCGRGDHFVGKMATTPMLNHIDMSQPHLNDMEKVFPVTVDRGLNLTLMHGDWEKSMADGAHDWRRLHVLQGTRLN